MDSRAAGPHGAGEETVAHHVRAQGTAAGAQHPWRCRSGSALRAERAANERIEGGGRSSGVDHGTGRPARVHGRSDEQALAADFQVAQEAQNQLVESCRIRNATPSMALTMPAHSNLTPSRTPKTRRHPSHASSATELAPTMRRAEPNATFR